MSPHESFRREVDTEIELLGQNEALKSSTRAWMDIANEGRYSYHFEWLGRPIIQYPQDIVAIQEVVWRVKPDLIIETGVAHGGSLMLSASILALLDFADAAMQGGSLDTATPARRVIGIDIDIRAHNRLAIETHPLHRYIELVEGSSVASSVLDDVRARARSFDTILVVLDSNHTHEHVLRELEGYAPLVTANSYCVVMDTVVERLGAGALNPERPWGRGNNPMTAAQAFLASHSEFEADTSIDNKLMISVAPGGYLKRVR